MVAEAEKFASEDEAQRKRIEALNSLSSFVYGLKTQLLGASGSGGSSSSNREGLGGGGKIPEGDKMSLLAAIKETTEWIDENGSKASLEDLEEKLAGLFVFFFKFCPMLIIIIILTLFSFRGSRCR